MWYLCQLSTCKLYDCRLSAMLNLFSMVDLGMSFRSLRHYFVRPCVTLQDFFYTFYFIKANTLKIFLTINEKLYLCFADKEHNSNMYWTYVLKVALIGLSSDWIYWFNWNEKQNLVNWKYFIWGHGERYGFVFLNFQ